jgi:peptidoglycan/xylan/chitin deacetylase (PgdA/CDA1 family)
MPFFSFRTSVICFSSFALAAIVGCQAKPTSTVATQVGTGVGIDRVPASTDVEQDLEQETSFQQMLNDTEGSVKLKTNYLERLLRVHYRAELYVTKFEENLNELLAQQKVSPKAKFDPLDSEAYRRLLQMWMISSHTTDKMKFMYKRLHETSADANAASDIRRKAADILDETHKWLDSRPEEDKLQLIDLYQSLGEIKKKSDQAGNAQTGGNRQTASAFADFTDLDSKELEARFKAKAAVIAEKAKAQATWHDQDEDADITWLRPESDRMPASAKIFPSTGPEGNTYGMQFPDGTFVLTFDDGPAAHSTQRLHGILKAHSDPVNPRGAPATFFPLVQKVLKLPNVVAATKAAGYHMNNHSWTHPNFAKLSTAQLKHEVVDSTPVLERAFGYKFKFFRCPYGACFAPKIPVVRQMIADQGLIHAYWRIDSLDWKNIGQPQRTFDIITKQIMLTRKGVILIHDIHESSVDAAGLVLKWIKAQNSSARSPFKIKLKDLEAAVDEVNGVKPH